MGYSKVEKGVHDSQPMTFNIFHQGYDSFVIESHIIANLSSVLDPVLVQ